MATSTKIVGTCVDEASVGTRIWANPSNATANDTSYATTPDVKNTSMHYLFGTMSGNLFSIPGGATIDGVTVGAVLSQTTASAFTDGVVKLVIAGSAAGTSEGRGPTTYWPTTGALVNWGSGINKWGNTLTPAIVNAAGFGACIQGVEVSGNKSTGSVDYIELTVHYTEGGAAEVANVTDDAGASTTSDRATVATRPTTDSANASTSAVRLLAATRPTTDGADASTTATATKSSPADVSDSAEASTAATATKAASASETSVAEASTAATTTKTTSVSTTDSVDASTAVTATKSAPADVTDGAEAATSAVLTKTASASETSNAEASTSATTTKTTSISKTDTVDASTSATAASSLAVSETSAAEASDSATFTKTTSASVTDGVDGSTSATTTKTTSISTTDSAEAGTDATASISKSASVVDGADAGDSVTTMKAASANVSDSADASTTSTATTVIEYFANVTDGVGAVSTSIRQAGFGRTHTDSAGGATAPVRQTDAGREQGDDAEASDAPTRQTVAARSQVDDVEASTASTMLVLDEVATVSDSVGASDEARRTWPASRTRYESVWVEDTIDLHNNHHTTEHTDNVTAHGHTIGPDPIPGLNFWKRGVSDDVGVRDGALSTTKGGGGPDPAPGAIAITPEVSHSVGGNTYSTSYVFSGDPFMAQPCKISGFNMSVGVDYLVMATATLSNSNPNTIADVKLVVDRNTSSSVCPLRFRSAPTGAGSPPTPPPAGHISGFAIVTGAGNSNSDIDFAFLTRSSSSYTSLTHPYIIAIPLNELTENTDYWVFEQIGDSGSGISTGLSWEDIGSVTLTGIDAGDYLVLASTEMKTSSGEITQVRVQIDGITQKEAFREMSTNSSRNNMCMAYSRLHTLGSGDRTITLQGGSYLGTSDKHYHRSKVIVVKASLWNQMVDTSDDTEVPSTAFWPTGDELESQDITLASSGWIVGLSNMRLWRDGGGGSTGHIGKQGGTRGSQDISVPYRHDDSRASQTGIYCEDELQGSKVLTQNVGYRFGDVDTITDHRDLIIWEMRLAGAAAAGVADVTDNAGATDTVTASKVGDFPRTHTDNAGATDSADMLLEATRPVTDGVDAGDATTRATEAIRSTTDDVGADDTPDVTTVGSISVADDVGADDTVTRTTVAARSTTDGAGAGDSVTGVKGVAGYTADGADGAGASDNITIALTLNRAVQDLLAVSDQVNKDIDKRIADAVGASDTSSLTLTTVVEHTDSAAASDSIATQFTFDRTVGDSVGASELINRVGVYARSNTDDAAAVDAFIAQLGGEGIDALTVTSTISTEADLVSTIYETGGS